MAECLHKRREHSNIRVRRKLGFHAVRPNHDSPGGRLGRYGLNRQLFRFYHSGKAVLLFYSWNDFDASWFVGESEIENKALLVEPQCSHRFVELCRTFSSQITAENRMSIDIDELPVNLDEHVIKTSIAAGAAVESSQIAIFAEHKASINTPAGHGEMAEESHQYVG